MAADLLLLLSFPKKTVEELENTLKDTFKGGNGFYIDERSIFLVFGIKAFI